LLERDFLSKLKVQILLPLREYFCISLIEEQVDSSVWMDGSTIGRIKTVSTVQVHLNDPLQFPHQKPYPLKPEPRRGLLPIINNRAPIPTIPLFWQYKRVPINGGWYKTSNSSMRL
jgi:hypothetical protein